MNWTVLLTTPGRDTIQTQTLPYIGAEFLEPRSYAGVRWFVMAVFIPTAIDVERRMVMATFAHLKKHHLDQPRDPARLPA